MVEEIPPLVETGLQRVASQIVHMVGIRETVRAKRVVNGDIISLTIEGINHVYPHSINPKEWRLGPSELDSVLSSVYDTGAKALRVVLVPPSSGTHAAAHGWTEEVWRNSTIDPANVDVVLDGTDNINAEIVPLVVAIAKEIAAVALMRKGSCKSSIVLSPGSPAGTVCVIATTGIAMFGCNALAPMEWATLLSPSVRRTLNPYYNVQRGELRTRISDNTVIAFLGRLVPAPPCALIAADLYKRKTPCGEEEKSAEEGGITKKP